MRAWVVLLAVTVVLAGCSGPAKAPDQEPDIDFGDVEATATTGIIRGIVVDEAIRPLAGALVRLTTPDGPRTTNTTEAGAFGFDGLAPGTYFLVAELTGYTALQGSAEVVAGVDDPPAVKLLLTRLPGYAPYFEARVYEGYIQCTLSFLVLCGIANLQTGEQITNDRYTWTWYFEPNATLLQSELVWDSTQPLTPTMYYDMRPDGDCDEGFGNSTEGTSPIYATINGTEFSEGGINLEDCGIYFALFSGHNEPIPRWPLVGWGWGATVSQQFKMFVHTFYDFVPPPGWRFSVDGEPQVPST